MLSAEAKPHQHGAMSASSEQMIDAPDRFLLIAAAGAAAPDEAAFVRNIELVHRQLELGERLFDVMSAAWDAIDGRPQAFRGHLAMFDRCWLPGDGPLPFPDPGGGFPPTPWPRRMPFPCPDRRAPRLPPIRECDGEAARALREALDRTVQYTIDSVEPADACPGDTITIRGESFLFEGESGGVWFSSGRRGMPIFATPTSVTETEIRVVVPAGAQCGPLELDVPVGGRLLVCGTI